jgi:hypothetical protein
VPFDIDNRLALDARRQRRMQQNYRLFPDVHPCLAAQRLGVVSNSDGPHQRAKLSSVGLKAAFEVVVISRDVWHPKPDPRIFLPGLPPVAAAAGEGSPTSGSVGHRRGRHRERRRLAEPDGRSRSSLGEPRANAWVPVISGLDELPGSLSSLSPADSADSTDKR